MKNKRLYNIWCLMKGRCYNMNHHRYGRYGARGIEVCDEWKNDFKSFEKWAMANGYRDDLTIDRIDNDGPYSPNNCRWATRKEQSNNSSNNHLISVNGEIYTASQLAEAYGIPRQTFYRRLQRGWDITKALCQPVRAYAGGDIA